MVSLEYTNESVEKTVELLKTSAFGLPEKEAVLRRKKYGANEINIHQHRALDILLRQCRSPFFYLLATAGFISLFIGERVDSAVILILVVVNIFIGFIQEYRAERAVSLLQRIIPQSVKVLRQGKQEMIEKRFLVVGDVVVFRVGDVIPAELRVIECAGFLMDESALTGESVPVEKTIEPLNIQNPQIYQAKNMLFAGTSVISGTAKGVVVATGKDTALGQIVETVAVHRHGGAYEKNLLYFCRLILKIVLVTIAIIFVLNFFLKGGENIFSFSLFCVALIVSILPEALPAIVVLALSRGSLKMAKDNVVVKRLEAIEDLGNIEVLCSDKTGTLTQNKLTLEKVVASDKDKALLYALLSSNKDSLDPFDKAFFERAGAQPLKRYSFVAELPFDSFRMRSSVAVKREGGEQLLIVKGAPEVVLKLCSKLPRGFDKKETKEEVAHLGHEGKRTLAIAYKKFDDESIKKTDEKGLTFLGYFVFEDPLKSTAEESIRLARKLGVQIKIITGDAPEVSGYVAKSVGLITSNEKVILGQDLEKMSRDDFDLACEENVVFARISPETKYNIIKSLQKKYEVGFLGEGINDAPALKIADVGIAVANASDIAREASDVVLLKKDLRVLISGIKHGRTIFANINKYIKCTLASNFGNFYSIGVISLFINFLPMLPVQILLANLLSDFPLIAIVSDSVDIEELRKPKQYQLHMVLPLIIALALVSTVFDFIFFTIFHNLPAQAGQDPSQIQTLWFVMSIFTEVALIFIIRTRYKFWKAKSPSFWLSGLSIASAGIVLVLPFLVIGHELFHFATPAILPLFVIFGLVGAYFVASELVKLVYFHYFKLPKTVLEK